MHIFTPEKINAKWIFHEFLDLTHKQNVNSTTKYELIAVMTHLGLATMGHYVIYLKQQGKWYELSDSIVVEVD